MHNSKYIYAPQGNSSLTDNATASKGCKRLSHDGAITKTRT